MISPSAALGSPIAFLHSLGRLPGSRTVSAVTGFTPSRAGLALRWLL